MPLELPPRPFSDYFHDDTVTWHLPETWLSELRGHCWKVSQRAHTRGFAAGGDLPPFFANATFLSRRAVAGMRDLRPPSSELEIYAVVDDAAVILGARFVAGGRSVSMPMIGVIDRATWPSVPASAIDAACVNEFRFCTGVRPESGASLFGPHQRWVPADGGGLVKVILVYAAVPAGSKLLCACDRDDLPEGKAPGVVVAPITGGLLSKYGYFRLPSEASSS